MTSPTPTDRRRPKTPAERGPERRWTCEERHPAGVHWDTVIRDETGAPVASVYAAGWDRLATRQHAELIAAAPELLKALKEIAASIGNHHGAKSASEILVGNFQTAMRAIARAEPRS